MGLNPNALVELATAKAFIQPGGMSAADDQRLQEVIDRNPALIVTRPGRVP